MEHLPLKLAATLLVVIGFALFFIFKHQAVAPSVSHNETLSSSSPLSSPSSPTSSDSSAAEPKTPARPGTVNSSFSPTNFHGPTGEPHIIGPTSNPPNY